MCGIVGHVGLSSSIEVVMEGLKRLEYRGYDSAGVCFKNEIGQLSIYKKAGKLENLKNFLKENSIIFNASACIGHTRWATHGEVSDLNAHPHLSDTIAIDDDKSIAIVHNGIIENDIELKEELTRDEGLKFSSQTDSEVFLGLLVVELLRGENFHDSARKAFKRIKGNSAFVIQIKGSKELLAIKRGAPLVCGTNMSTEDAYVSSDPYALAGMADKLYFPEDEVLCCLNPISGHPIEFFELNGEKSHRVEIKEHGMSVEISEKGQFEHYMLKEIYEQPHLIRHFADFYYDGQGRDTMEVLSKLTPSRIHIVGCGTAWHAGLVIKNFLERMVGIPTLVELASEFRYREPILRSDELAIFISQSGETADTLAAQELCKKKKIKTLSIVNVEGSTLYRNCDENLFIRAGVEIGVASTKAFTLQALCGRLLTAALGNDISLDSKQKRVRLLNLLAERIEVLLQNADMIKGIAQSIYGHKGFIFTGRGEDFPIALEGALKLKEIAYVHSEGYASGELKHGPIALIDDNIVNIAIVSEKLYDKTVSNIQEVKARGGVMVIVGPAKDQKLENLSDYYIPMNYKGLNEFSPLYINVALQLLSYFMARFKGTDIDMPRNLAKSVTVE